MIRTSILRLGPKNALLLGAVTVVLLMLSSTEALAACEGGKEEGISLAEKARAVEDDDPARAASLYRKALKCRDNPVVFFFLGKVLERQGKLTEARTTYQSACALNLPESASPSWKDHVQQACEQTLDVERRIPKLRWTVEADDFTVFVDGVVAKEQPLELDPGAHEIEARSEGRSVTEDFTLGEGDDELIELRFTGNTGAGDSASTSPAPWATLGMVGFVLAGAGAVVWGVSGGVFLSRKGDLETECPTPEQCDNDELIDDTKLAGNVSTAGVIILGIGVAMGVTFTILDASAGSDTEAAIRVGPGHVSAILSF